MSFKCNEDYYPPPLRPTSWLLKPTAASRNEEECADASPGEGTAGSDFATRIASWGRALEAAAAPFSYLFGTVGSVPGWFSDAVFEVRGECFDYFCFSPETVH